MVNSLIFFKKGDGIVQTPNPLNDGVAKAIVVSITLRLTFDS